MEDAYGIGITNRYDYLGDTDVNDPQAILKKMAKKAKKAKYAKKKLSGKEQSENDAKVETFLVPGKAGNQLQSQQEPAQNSRSLKDTQNIQGNRNGLRDTKNDFDRERYTGNNENRENREQRNNRRNRPDTNDAGDQTYQENGTGKASNRGYRQIRQNDNKNNENNGQCLEYNNQRDNDQPARRQGYDRKFGNRDGGNRRSDAVDRPIKYNDYRNNENICQDIEYNDQRDNDRPSHRQGYDRNFGNRDGGNRRNDGQRRNFDGRGGKREFDRQSGSDKTGVKAIEKREGGGAHNWGTHKQDIEDLNKNGLETDLKEEGNSVENAKSEENLAVQELMTYDEYMKLKGERTKPVYNTRRAGEGEDKKKYKNMIPLQKKNEDVEEEYEYEFDPSLYPQRKRKVKSINDVINVRFNESKRIGNFRNNNDRRRRQKNNDGVKNDEAIRQNAPQVDDRNFPSLG